MPDSDRSDSPPFLGTWANVYKGVLIYLATLLLLLYIATLTFRY